MLDRIFCGFAHPESLGLIHSGVRHVLYTTSAVCLQMEMFVMDCGVLNAISDRIRKKKNLEIDALEPCTCILFLFSCFVALDHIHLQKQRQSNRKSIQRFTLYHVAMVT